MAASHAGVLSENIEGYEKFFAIVEFFRTRRTAGYGNEEC